jgi:hypothetical protein
LESLIFLKPFVMMESSPVSSASEEKETSAGANLAMTPCRYGNQHPHQFLCGKTLLVRSIEMIDNYTEVLESVSTCARLCSVNL